MFGERARTEVKAWIGVSLSMMVSVSQAKRSHFRWFCCVTTAFPEDPISCLQSGVR